MISLFNSNRSKAILGLGVIAIGISTISKKVINYPSVGCMKGGQEMTFYWDKSIINKPLIGSTLEKRIYLPYQTITENYLHCRHYRYFTGKAPPGLHLPGKAIRIS